jgi:VanZ family protein
MATILFFSGDTLAFGRTAMIIAWFLGLFGVQLSLPTLLLINVIARKMVHVVTYGVLSLLVFRAVRGNEGHGWHLRWVLWAVAITLAVASLDEFRQTFYPDRSGTLMDLLYDGAGAALAQLLVWWRMRERVGAPLSASAE